MNKRLLTLGLGITAALAIGVGLAFRSVVNAVADTPSASGALAHIGRAWNAHHGASSAPATAQQQQAAPAAPQGDVVYAAGDVFALGPDAAGGRIVEGPGVLVTGVVADGPAAKAGIVRGDIVLAVDGKDVKQMIELHKALAAKKDGDVVRLKVQHGDDVRDRDVTLAGQGMAMLGIVSCGGGMAPRIAIRHLMGGPAVIDEVTADSPAAKAGLKSGDRITAVDGVKLTGASITMHGGEGSHITRMFRYFLGKGDGADDEKAGDAAAGVAAAGDAATSGTAPGGEAQSVPAVPAAPVAPAAPVPGAAAAAPVKAEGLTLAAAIAGHKPGDSVKLTVERDGEPTRDVTVVLAASPDDATKAFLGVTYGGAMEMGGAMIEGMPGMPAMPAMPAMPGMAPMPGMPGDQDMHDLFGQLGDNAGGIVVGDVTADSAAAKAGLQAHDVISKVDGAPVDGPEALAKAVAARKPGQAITLTILRQNEAPRDVAVTLGARPDDAAKAFLGVSMMGFFMHREAPGVVPPDGAQPGGATFEQKIDLPPSSNA